MSARMATAAIDLQVFAASHRPQKVAETVGRVIRKLLDGATRPEFFDARQFTVTLTQDDFTPRVIVTVTED